ncbi:MAG TPA: flavodoxin, partial [Clostridiales bacterium]|nr:flavodoxin [Clostridiales bacterium]
MHSVKKIDEDIYFVGVNDRRIELFENVYPVKNGVSYNSYVILDEKTCLIDTVDKSGEIQFKENVAFVLNGRKLDYIVVQHLEPDHSATLAEMVKEYPEAVVVYNKKAAMMVNNYFRGNFKAITVTEGNELPLGKHTLHFIDAPMVHWPEVTFSYDDFSKTLFSADAFGSFGALSGNIYADETDFHGEYTDEMRRYYTNIVGKYGAQ